MPFIKTKCEHCGKVAEAEREFQIGEKTVLLLKCSHIITKDHLNHSSPEQIISLDNKTLYPFQCEGVRFIENSGGRALVADEMGLGKTPQSIAACILHPDEMLPVITIGKAALLTQWQREWMRWGGEDLFAQIISGPKDYPIKGLKAYILSYDILRRFVAPKKKSGKDKWDELVTNHAESEGEEVNREEENKLKDLIERLGIKTIILDECQQIKNPESQRTVYVRAMCKLVPNVLALSGTPIKNNAAEYFPVLNILKPEIYPRFSTFLMRECDSYYNGYGYKTGGLRNPEAFKEKTKSFIIRRERKEVLPDLPPVRREHQFHELSKQVEEAYREEFVKFRDEYNSIGSEASFGEESNIMAYLSKMRHLTGLSKVDPCIDHVMEVMGSTEDRITIFHHHKDVGDLLEQKLNSIFSELGIPKCARHVAGSRALDTEERFAKSRVLICSTLAGGEGLNLQKLCFRFVMLERQWNPSNEKQAEDRFPRPEGLAVESIEGTYMIAVGTVDEFFSEIVERKREIVENTLGGREAPPWDQSSLMKELAEVLSINGGRKWGW